ncbi:hypothetical protein UFOVP187_27 [uncultured Caudovirales phage]|uniref:Uncharacterized protein n=1 Tax=uncultured Caudovirales phage TaxID=2100421 RepID=A0A6J7WFW3_9CAUD|nr:hypothetical protein UFOVP187_27 [uncultured Caudovirales phage]
MATTEKDQMIVRQNQSSNVRELLQEKGILNLLTTYEFAVYVELWSDYCVQGLIPEIKKRFQAFDKIIQERIDTSNNDVITL